MTKTQWRAFGAVLVVGVAFMGGLYLGTTAQWQKAAAASGITITVGTSTTPAAPSGVDMTQFWSAYNLLNQNFVQTHASSTYPTTQKQIDGAIEGLAASFGDPYTVFFPPADAKIFQDDIGGSFGGTGMQIDTNNKGQLVVVSPLKGTPSERAGILSGDIILDIGTTTTDGLSTEDAVKLIRGPVGTTVNITVQRSGTSTAPIVIPIVRDVINIPIIDTTARPDGVYVISLYSFSENSADLFRTALRSFVQSGDSKLVLDLRGNPGGYLNAAVDMASYFLPVGDTIVTEDYKGKNNQANDVSRSAGYNIFQGNPNFKMAILVDQGSASASEILSGALQQHGVAKLVGTRTFGKGSVQELLDLGGGAELKVTIARWLTPNGSSISDNGLQPDILATTTPELAKQKIDPQMDAAVKYLLGN